MSLFRTSEIFSNSRFTLIAVECVSFRKNKANTCYQLYVGIEAVAVVICDLNGVDVFDMKGGISSYEKLKQSVQGLDALIAPYVKKI